MGYGRTSYRRPVQRTGPRANKYDAGCSVCGRTVPAGAGVLTGNRDIGYQVRHGDRTWVGSPVSGKWAGGCEDFADQPVYVAPVRKTYAYTNTGARMTSRRGRCEDAPCCGCCD
jgi:hypothetical protein